MKQNTPLTILLMITLIIIVVFQFFYHKRQIKRLSKQITIEASKTSFAFSQLDKQFIPYDSVVSVYDTISFYKNSAFLGKHVITTE